ncbi:hypothetical protein AwDysgo_00600 [Bacteroidales bacterium]|nr:hypothetical protein AwDysgo_00600 [Bacteroidales bacterium]
MNTQQDEIQNPIFSKSSISFVKIALEFCTLVENVFTSEKQVFIDSALNILPLLYLHARMLPSIAEDYNTVLEIGVQEENYEAINAQIGSLLGEDNMYLETFHTDIQFSDLPVAVPISESLADIYQDIGNFIFNFQQGEKEIMSDSLQACSSNFKEYWGQSLVNVLRALHSLKN